MASRPQKSLPWIRPERNSPVSLQAQIAQWLEQLIVSGRLGPGDRLPSEAALGERLGVSRVTLRLAIDDLLYSTALRTYLDSIDRIIGKAVFRKEDATQNACGQRNGHTTHIPRLPKRSERARVVQAGRSRRRSPKFKTMLILNLKPQHAVPSLS